MEACSRDVVVCFQGFQAAHDARRCVARHATAGHVVVGGDAEENGVAVPDARRQQRDVVDAALEHGHSVARLDFREQSGQFGFVAAVGVDFGRWGLEQDLDQRLAAVPGCPEDGVSA